MLILIFGIILVHPIQEGLDHLYDQIRDGGAEIADVPAADGSTIGIHEHSIIVNIGQMCMLVGEQYQVPYSLDSPEAYHHELLWTSSNEDCIKVTNDGNLSAVGIGLSEITVCYKDAGINSINSNTESFLVFVLNEANSSPNTLSVDFSSVNCTTGEDEYIIIYDLNNPEKQALSEATIIVCTETGDIAVLNRDVTEYSSNFSGTFKLDYFGNYVLYAKVVTESGFEYVSQALIFRPNEHIFE